MFRADPIREQLRNVWLAALLVGAVAICHVAVGLVEPYMPVAKPRAEDTSLAWKVIIGIAVLAGGYLAMRDHVYRPFVTLAREIPDPSDMWRLIGRVALSGLTWAPVLSIGVSVLYFDGGGLWTVLQIGALLILWNVVQRQARPAVNKIAHEMLPQANEQA